MLDGSIFEILAPYKKIFVAYSGGVDSHVLLHALVKIWQKKNKQITLTAVHINHNVNPQSKKWEKHCKKVCQKLGVLYITKTIALCSKTLKCSPEEKLRKLRYALLAKVLPKNACLVTAHHKDDQAETLLLQLLRGAGPKGLAGMPRHTSFAKGYLVRPFLDCTRDTIKQYAMRSKLQWIEDTSNLDVKFTRNFIRHQVLPLLQTRWPTVTNVLQRVARHCGTSNELLEILAALDLAQLSIRTKQNILSVKKLSELTLPRRQNVLRFWFEKNGFTMPSEVKIHEIMRTILQARHDAMPCVSWRGTEIRRFGDQIYIMPPFNATDKKKLKKYCQDLQSKIIQNLKLKPSLLHVYLRTGGEKIKLVPRGGTHSLKKLFQEWHVPPWERERIPIVEYSGTIVAVVGYYCHPEYNEIKHLYDFRISYCSSSKIFN